MHIDTLIESAGWWAYLLVFAVTVSETSAFLGLLVPGETAILIAAALAGKGDLNPVILAAAVVTGGIIGDNLGYLLGRRCGRRPSSGRLRRFRLDAHLRRAQTFLVRHGGKAVFAGRFIGFIRTFLPFAAGASAMSYRRFFFFSTLASVVWGVGNVGLGYFAGTAATEFLHSAGAVGALALAAMALAMFVGLRLLKRRRHTGRAGSSIVASHRSLQEAVQDRALLDADTELLPPQGQAVRRSVS
ncbi:DedA family protein [Streptomyces sp. SS1-1]|uniref:DedA family protein n=1 Tax=Streptomyces sp. SS1-1 TaxID=2651869 RepID=UPI00124F8D22|nr:DedA family protein [Streptomyces sp. SS1-1]KAB2977542.1 DedA family protein [Streptomyces sp. SS1-1]